MCAAAALSACAPGGQTRKGVVVQPAIVTEPVADDPDDPALWIHPTDPSKSLILGTDKGGALYSFGLDGRIRQTVRGIPRPNNVDVEYGFETGGRIVDIAGVTSRDGDRLWIFAIDRDTGALSDISGGGLPVFARPMGIGFYKRPRDGAIFAILSRKDGPSGAYLWQYRVTPASPGAGIEPGAAGAAINKVREFGAFGGGGEIEAVAVDAELGHVYYADESHGIRQYHADPDAPDAAREIAMFGTSGWTGDREGLALYKLPGGEGYLLAVDQIPAGSRCHLFRRGAGHELVRVVETTAVSTDGIEATSRPLGPGFPRGVVAVMNESGKNFYLYRWEDFAP